LDDVAPCSDAEAEEEDVRTSSHSEGACVLFDFDSE
jgi:hypothetical protein